SGYKVIKLTAEEMERTPAQSVVDYSKYNQNLSQPFQ
ncbi:unnamed protein product, partial [marine sediment metagenome]